MRSQCQIGMRGSPKKSDHQILTLYSATIGILILLVHFNSALLLVSVIIYITTTRDRLAGAASNFIEGFPVPGPPATDVLDANISLPTFEPIAGSKIIRMHGELL